MTSCMQNHFYLFFFSNEHLAYWRWKCKWCWFIHKKRIFCFVRSSSSLLLFVNDQMALILWNRRRDIIRQHSQKRSNFTVSSWINKNQRNFHLNVWWILNLYIPKSHYLQFLSKPNSKHIKLAHIKSIKKLVLVWITLWAISRMISSYTMKR